MGPFEFPVVPGFLQNQGTTKNQILYKDIGFFKLEHFEFGHKFPTEVKYSWRVSEISKFE